MTTIVEELLDLAKEELGKRRVIDIRIGLSYTAVLLDDQGMGLAYTLRDDASSCCETMKRAGNLEGNAWELAKLAISPRALDATVGMATLNALFNREVLGNKGDVMDFLKISQGDKVGMVGNFRPLLKRIDKKGIELFIFERKNGEDENIYPDWAAEQILPTVDIAIISATSVINKTADHLIELSRNARDIVILGPTTPLVPEVFWKRGVTILSGMEIKDTEKALKIVSQGGGTPLLKETGVKISCFHP